MSNHISIGHFITVTSTEYIVCFVDDCFLSWVLYFNPHPLAQHYMVAAWIPKFPNYIVIYCYLHTIFYTRQ